MSTEISDWSVVVPDGELKTFIRWTDRDIYRAMCNVIAITGNRDPALAVLADAGTVPKMTDPEDPILPWIVRSADGKILARLADRESADRLLAGDRAIDGPVLQVVIFGKARSVLETRKDTEHAIFGIDPDEAARLLLRLIGR